MTINEDVFRISELFTISHGSRIKADVLTLEAIRNGVKGLGEAVPYARYGETLQYVKVQIEIIPDTFTRHELKDLMAAARRARPWIVRLGVLRQRRPANEFGNWQALPCLTHSRVRCLFYFVEQTRKDAGAGQKKLLSLSAQDQTWDTR